MTEELELGQLWDNYGIVGDVVVSISMFFLAFLPSLSGFPSFSFTRLCPRHYACC